MKKRESYTKVDPIFIQATIINYNEQVRGRMDNKHEEAWLQIECHPKGHCTQHQIILKNEMVFEKRIAQREAVSPRII